MTLRSDETIGCGDFDAAAAGCGLLVSVQSLAEAEVAAAAGATVIDFKDPAQGPLGAAAPPLWQAAAARLAVWDGRRSAPPPRLSAALGELCDGARERARALPCEFRFAKAGPAGLADAAALGASWRALRTALAPSVSLVAVAYADAARAGCAEPEAILEAAAEAGIGWFLIDTFSKEGATCKPEELAAPRPAPSTPEILGLERLLALGQRARALSVRWVLAGSLRGEHRRAIGAAAPDLVGLRGTLCRGGRRGVLDADSVRQWRAWLGRAITLA